MPFQAFDLFITSSSVARYALLVTENTDNLDVRGRRWTEAVLELMVELGDLPLLHGNWTARENLFIFAQHSDGLAAQSYLEDGLWSFTNGRSLPLNRRKQLVNHLRKRLPRTRISELDEIVCAWKEPG